MASLDIVSVGLILFLSSLLSALSLYTHRLSQRLDSVERKYNLVAAWINGHHTGTFDSHPRT